MPQIVFIHGPGAGGCADGYYHQLKHFPDALAPTLPGHPHGASCPDVKSNTEWVRGWLWARGHSKDLVLVGQALGACIALQYALDYPDEVRAIAIATVAMRSKARPTGAYELRERAMRGDAKAYEEWVDHQKFRMKFVDPELKARLVQKHLEIGPASQLHDLKIIADFNCADRIGTLKPKLLLVRGLEDPSNPPEYEKEIHQAVPGSRYVGLMHAGHFPPMENPAAFNKAVEELVAGL